VADSLSEKKRGKGFGIHRAMDTSGAFLGLAIAAFIIYNVQGGGLELGLDTYRWMVLIGIIPAVLAVLVLLSFVRERKAPDVSNVQGVTAAVKRAPVFDTRFKIFLVIMAIFTLGNSSDFFIVLRAQDLGAPVLQVTLMLVLFNVTYALSSVPAGMLSDKLGRKRVIVMGWAIYALVYLGFAAVSSLWHVWVLFAGYGIYYGIVEGVARAMVADLVPEERRGTAYGLYHGVVGLTLLPASLIAGRLWEVVSPAATFYLGAGLAFIAALGILVFLRK
jgi:MFS family permease